MWFHRWLATFQRTVLPSYQKWSNVWFQKNFLPVLRVEKLRPENAGSIFKTTILITSLSCYSSTHFYHPQICGNFILRSRPNTTLLNRCHMQYSHWLTALVVTFLTLVQDILVILYLCRFVVGLHRLSLGRWHVRVTLTKSCLSLYYRHIGVVNGLWYSEALFFLWALSSVVQLKHCILEGRSAFVLRCRPISWTCELSYCFRVHKKENKQCTMKSRLSCNIFCAVHFSVHDVCSMRLKYIFVKSLD
jgi:hypothetical protein